MNILIKCQIMCDNNIFCDLPIYDSKSTSLSLIVDLSKFKKKKNIYIYVRILLKHFH